MVGMVRLAPGTPPPVPVRHDAVEDGDHIRVGGDLVTLSTDGVAANRPCRHPAVSGDRRFTAFDSGASNLLWWDFHGPTQIYVHDAHKKQTVMVSTGDAGQQADGECLAPDVSDDGRFAVFLSRAGNIAPQRLNRDVMRVYLHDGEKHCNLLLSPQDIECTAADISDDGHVIRFATAASEVYQVENPQADMVAARQRRRDMEVLQKAVQKPSSHAGSIEEDDEHVQIGELKVSRP